MRAAVLLLGLVVLGGCGDGSEPCPQGTTTADPSNTITALQAPCAGEPDGLACCLGPKHGYCRENECTPVCSPNVPLATRPGSGFGTWATVLCAGEAAGPPEVDGARCVQFLDTGEVFCVDLSQPLPAMYGQGGGVCAVVVTAFPPYVWQSCGPEVAP